MLLTLFFGKYDAFPVVILEVVGQTRELIRLQNVNGDTSYPEVSIKPEDVIFPRP